MLAELLEAVQFGKEVGKITNGLINGDNYDVVDNAISMYDAIDYNTPTWREEINEILNNISCVSKNDRAFVWAAASFIRACCYFDLGNYAKSRQNISECTMISVDSWTINKEFIIDCQKRAKELQNEIEKQTTPKPQISSSFQNQPYPQDSNNRNKQQKQQHPPKQKQQQIQNPCTNKQYTRAELLRIVAECCGDNPNQVSEDSWRGGDRDTMVSNLKNRYGIIISKTQANKSTLYKGLIDYIIEHSGQGTNEKRVDTAVQKSASFQDATSSKTASSVLPHIQVNSVSLYQHPFDSSQQYVQCIGEFKGKTARFNALEVVIENSSSNILYGQGCAISVSRFGQYCEKYDNNSIRVGESVRIVIPNLNPQDIKPGAKIFVAEDYFLSKGKRVVCRDQNGKPMMLGTIGVEKEPFEMTIEGRFHIEGRGEIITGTITSGAITSNTMIYLSTNDTVITARVEAIEMSKNLFTYAEKGDYIGMLLSGISYDEIHEGMRVSLNAPKKDGHPGEKSITSSIPEDTIISSFSSNELEYLDEVKECLTDGEIGAGERRLLDKLRAKLGISSERAGELEASLQPQLTDDEKEYLDEYKAVAVDGVVTDKERRLLEKLRKMLDISEDRASEIEHMKG